MPFRSFLFKKMKNVFKMSLIKLRQKFRFRWNVTRPKYYHFDREIACELYFTIKTIIFGSGNVLMKPKFLSQFNLKLLFRPLEMERNFVFGCVWIFLLFVFHAKPVNKKNNRTGLRDISYQSLFRGDFGKLFSSVEKKRFETFDFLSYFEQIKQASRLFIFLAKSATANNNRAGLSDKW